MESVRCSLPLSLLLMTAACGEANRTAPQATSTSTSSSSGGVGGSTSSGDGVAGASNSEEGFHVEAWVDGELLHADLEVYAWWWPGLTGDQLMVHARTEEWTWYVWVVNLVGPTTCGAGSFTLAATNSSASLTSEPTGADTEGCTLLVDQAAPKVGDVLEGTFSGMLSGAGTSKLVTMGSFRARRTADED